MIFEVIQHQQTPNTSKIESVSDFIKENADKIEGVNEQYEKIKFTYKILMELMGLSNVY